MAVLVLGLLLFLGVHSVRIYADGWRTEQIQHLGKLRWRGMYAFASLAGFALIVWGFGLARTQPVILWSPPVWTRHVAAVLVLFAFVLLVAAYVPGTRIKSALGHPMLAGVKVWALAHLLANGTLADVVLFGSFLFWAVVAFISARRRDRAAGTNYSTAGLGRDALAIGVGTVAWALFARFGHEWLIGVKPFG